MNLNPAIEFIVNFLIGKTGDYIYNKWKYRRKIKRVLKNDIKNINRIFFDDKKNVEMFDLINDFLIGTIFMDESFYYLKELTAEQENKAWEMFQEHVKTLLGNDHVNINYRNKIIKCIILHNDAVTNIMMNYESKLQMSVMQRNHKSIEQELNNIFEALNTNTRAQKNDDELDFFVLQLESIMKSYMYDIKQLRKQEIFTFWGLAIIFLTTIIANTFFRDYYKNITIIYVVSILSIIIVGFWMYNTIKKLHRLEASFEFNREHLFRIHLEYYKNTLKNIRNPAKYT